MRNINLKIEKKYSREELLNYLTEFEKREGRVATNTDIRILSKTGNFPSIQPYISRFGGVNHANRLAGLIPPNPVSSSIDTPADLVKSVQEFRDNFFSAHQYYPSVEEIHQQFNAAFSRFHIQPRSFCESRGYCQVRSSRLINRGGNPFK